MKSKFPPDVPIEMTGPYPRLRILSLKNIIVLFLTKKDKPFAVTE